jgi:CBS domain-containing protein
MDPRSALERETVREVGYRDLVSVEIGATLGEATHLMREREVGCLCVLDGGRLAGIFTERNLVARGLAEGTSMDTPLRELMTPDPVSALPDEPLHAVLAKMHAGDFRHVPVVDDTGRPLGTISVKRAVRFLADKLPEAILNLPPDPGAFPAQREGG